MAVYEHTYKPYAGSLTPEWSRFLIIPRHAYRDIFQSKLFTGFFAISLVPALVMAILIYLHHNLNALAILDLNLSNLVPIDSSFFRVFVMIQSTFAFLLTVLIGPVLISRDLTNNALPLYLCRPFSRAEYIIGKMMVLVILMSAIMWIPGLLLFLFQSYLEGGGWFTQNLWIANATFLVSWVWILLLSLLSVTLSAWVKWRVAASAGIFAMFIISNVIGIFINELFDTWTGNLINLTAMMQTVTDGLFRYGDNTDYFSGYTQPAVWGAWIALGCFCALCLALLSVKVRAYEVVK